MVSFQTGVLKHFLLEILTPNIVNLGIFVDINNLVNAAHLH